VEIENCLICNNRLSGILLQHAQRRKSNEGIKCRDCQENERVYQIQRSKIEDEKAASIFGNSIDIQIESWMPLLGVPRRNVHCSIDNFRGSKPLERPGLITGQTGTGKTHLAVGFIRKEIKDQFFKEYAARGLQDKVTPKPSLLELKACLQAAADQIRFISALEFVWQMRKPDRADEIMNTYTKVDLLVLDDFGAERPTEWALECLGKLIYTRHADMRNTTLTSNLNLDEIGKAFNPRISSRIAEFGPWIELQGKDQRMEQLQA
jgi:DNA replication protein DnaC